MMMDGVTAASIPHGQKRHADDSLESDQRLSKRFNLLNLGILCVIFLCQFSNCCSLQVQSKMAGFTSQSRAMRETPPKSGMLKMIQCNWMIAKTRSTFTI